MLIQKKRALESARSLLARCCHAFAFAFARAAKKALIAFSLRSTLCARSNARPHFAFVTPQASSTRAALNFVSLAFVVVALRLLAATLAFVARLSSSLRVRVALARAVVVAFAMRLLVASFACCFVAARFTLAALAAFVVVV